MWTAACPDIHIPLGLTISTSSPEWVSLEALMNITTYNTNTCGMSGIYSSVCIYLQLSINQTSMHITTNSTCTWYVSNTAVCIYIHTHTKIYTNQTQVIFITNVVSQKQTKQLLTCLVTTI